MNLNYRMKTYKRLFSYISLFLVTVIITSCSGGNTNIDTSTRIVLAAYTTPREAYREIIPLFQQKWEAETGQKIIFEESYLGSGAQSRAVVEGFEADIAALSLEADITRIEKAGLITHDWRSKPFNGMVSTSIVSFAVRTGNPKNIQDWDDLVMPDVNILTPNPKTSGGAMWNILGLYGAAKRGFVENVIPEDEQAAQDFFLSVLRNVSVMDKSARESITNFEKGVGDVAITYENEVLVGQQAGQNYELVIPRSTILIENPIALIDQNVEKHKNRAVVEAFVEFLFSPEAQEIFAKHGLRSPDPIVAERFTNQYPPVEDLFTIEYFGGWDTVMVEFFADNGIYDQTVLRWQGSNQ
ncbi:MAG: sulfate ABC transporter substrate-binding protein [Anaerolineaceae bacterium]|nr:sulfate ABC transporter substrate-binding protein [Anaerolineaceae bacterium]